MKYSILLCFIIFSCGPAYKLRRAERLIQKAESQGATWHNDTIYQEVEVLVPSVTVDTVIQNVDFTDTVIIKKDSIITKLKVDTRTNTVYVSTDCPERLVTQRVPVIINKTIYARSWLRWWYLIIAACVGYIVARITNLRLSNLIR